MICPKCGTENKSKFKFCVKCGSNLENPGDWNIEQIDMGGYRSEEDYSSEKNSFKIGSGTFTVSDRAPVAAQGMFTAAELNDTDEEFDFSSYDEPYIPKLDAERLTVPTGGQNRQTVQQNAPVQQGGFPQQPVMQQGVPGQMMNGMMNPQQGVPMQSQMQGQPIQNGQPMNAQPQMQGMGMNPYMSQMYAGQPMYGAQPVMPAPQIIGYDPSGMPIYGQPQPVMYAPPMTNENGEPRNNAYPGAQSAMPQMMGMPAAMPGMPQTPPTGMYGGAMSAQPPRNQAQNAPQPEDGKVKVSNEFWDSFFSGNGENDDDEQDDFFSKPRHSNAPDMGSVSAEGMDLSRLQKHERKKNTYMNDTPEVNAEDLKPNKADELNKRFMRPTAVVNADELEAKKQEKTQDKMGVTADVSAEELEAYEHKKTRVTMKQTEKANADDLEVYEHEHKEAIMEQADHAVEALPKKKTAPIDEIDAIELPEYMQARKTVHSETPEIPGLPEI